MIRRVVLLAACFVILVAPLAFSQPQPPQAATTQEKPTPAPAAAPQPAPTPRPPAQMVTVRIDLTITDQVGTAAPFKKTMTLLAADGERASVRSLNRSTSRSFTAQFNVDAKPVLIQDRIRLDLSVIYDPPEIIAAAGTDKDAGWSTTLQESMGITLENGKPMIVSQSADPRTDRKVTVEVKATVLK